MDNFIPDIDPFIFQLVTVPALTIGIGVTISMQLNRISPAPIITFLLVATTEWLVIGRITSWSWILPLVPLIIVGLIAFIKKYSI
ncbi:hypothetical protein [Shouchella patagoniensis]|uniref:hypothetical protein n=1 Tax=Shouchella patagoniensis TaxID=228576 RepID=UPI000994D1DD|nr:hypothetical protein [Shouchella patagoniensis]